MAIDLHRPARPRCAWLKSVLLSLEASGVREATIERWPPRYHIAVFPKPYAAYVNRLTRRAGTTPATDRWRPRTQRVTGLAIPCEAATSSTESVAADAPAVLSSTSGELARPSYGRAP